LNQDLIRDFMNRFDMVSPGDSVLVGLSGGKDSVCLLHLLLALKEKLGIRKIGALHINHNLRGREADEDQRFCGALCGQLSIEYFAESVRVKVLALKKNASLEETGRELRYALLQKYATLKGYTKIATAHNLDDQAETILFRLAKGTGLEGVSAIREVFGNVIRPLLNTSSRDILDFLEEHSIAFRTDSTNLVTSFDRNRIRHNVLPELRAINPGLSAALSRFRDITIESRKIIDRRIDDVLKAHYFAGKGGHEFRFGGLEPEEVKAALRRILRDDFRKNTSHDELESIMDLSRGVSGRYLTLSGDLEIHLNYESFCFRPPEGFFNPVSYRLEAGRTDLSKYGLILHTDTVESFPFSIGEDVIYIPACGSLTVRNRRSGDVFVPMSSGKRRKIKKYFNDIRIPRIMRDSVMMIADENKIYSIPGIAHSIYVNEPGHEKYFRIRIDFKDGAQR